MQLIQGSPWKHCGKEALVPWSLIESLTPLHGSIGNKLARTTSHLEKNYLFSPSAQTSALTFPTNKGFYHWLQLHHAFTSGEAISISRQHDSKYLNTWFNQAAQCIWTSSYSKEKNMASELPLCICFALGHCSHTTLDTEKAGCIHSCTSQNVSWCICNYLHTKKRKKERASLTFWLKEELEKLTSQAHFSLLALSRNKQFSWWRAACLKCSSWSELVFLTEPNPMMSALFLKRAPSERSCRGISQPSFLHWNKAVKDWNGWVFRAKSSWTWCQNFNQTRNLPGDRQCHLQGLVSGIVVWFIPLPPPPPTSTSKTASLNPTAKLKLTLTTPHSGLELPSVHRTPKKPPEETSSS